MPYMPQYFEAPEDQEKRKEREKDRPRKMCDDIREDLLACTYESSCVRDGKGTPKECLKAKDPSVERCQNIVRALFECKRSLIDMRRRFRGPRGY